MTDEQIKNLSPYHHDFLEVWGNAWSPRKVMAGTCEACVWGSGKHSVPCLDSAGINIERAVIGGREYSFVVLS